jgi:hypothetical protein
MPCWCSRRRWTRAGSSRCCRSVFGRSRADIASTENAPGAVRATEQARGSGRQECFGRESGDIRPTRIHAPLGVVVATEVDHSAANDAGALQSSDERPSLHGVGSTDTTRSRSSTPASSERCEGTMRTTASPGTRNALVRFCTTEVTRTWREVARPPKPRARMSWERFHRLLERYPLPRARASTVLNNVFWFISSRIPH